MLNLNFLGLNKLRLFIQIVVISREAWLLPKFSNFSLKTNFIRKIYNILILYY